MRKPRGLRDGDSVDVVHAHSSLRLRVEITDMTPPGVAVCYKSRWPPFDATRSNANTLNPGLCPDLGGGTAVNSLEISVAPSPEPIAYRS